MRSLILSASILIVLGSATSAIAQDRTRGPMATSPRAGADFARPARMSRDLRSSRSFGYRARVHGARHAYGYRSSRVYASYGYRPYRSYRTFAYGPAVGYRSDGCGCDW
jgi:hypothetical protein